MAETKAVPLPEARAVVVAARASRLSLLFSFILISSLAYSISSTDYTISLGSVSSEVSVYLALDHQYELYTVKVPLLGPAFDISVLVDGAPAGWSVDGSDLIVDYQRPAGSHTIQVTYYTDLVTYTEKGYLFSLTHTTPAPTRLSMKVVLPSHAVVSGSIPVSPQPSLSSDGQSILLSWSREMVVGESFSATGMYSSGSDWSWVIWLVGVGLLVVIAIVGAGILLFFRYQKASDGKVLSVLSEGERKVYQKVREVPGITQREVEEFTGFSKAKLSKLVRNLEMAGLLEKQPYRKTNKLRVKALVLHP